MIIGISKNKELTFSPTRYTGRHVPKTDGGRGDETEIKGVKEGPEVFRRSYNYWSSWSMIIPLFIDGEEAGSACKEDSKDSRKNIVDTKIVI